MGHYASEMGYGSYEIADMERNSYGKLYDEASEKYEVILAHALERIQSELTEITR